MDNNICVIYLDSMNNTTYNCNNCNNNFHIECIKN